MLQYWVNRRWTNPSDPSDVHGMTEKLTRAQQHYPEFKFCTPDKLQHVIACFCSRSSKKDYGDSDSTSESECAEQEPTPAGSRDGSCPPLQHCALRLPPPLSQPADRHQVRSTSQTLCDIIRRHFVLPPRDHWRIPIRFEMIAVRPGDPACPWICKCRRRRDPAATATAADATATCVPACPASRRDAAVDAAALVRVVGRPCRGGRGGGGGGGGGSMGEEGGGRGAGWKGRAREREVCR